MTTTIEKQIPIYDKNSVQKSFCTNKRAQRLINQGRAERYKDGIMLLVVFRNTSLRSKNNLYREANGRCYICGRKIHFKEMTIDHVFPQSSAVNPMIKNKMFIYSYKNKRCCCEKCNVDKGSLTLIEYCSKIEQDRKRYPLITNDKLSCLMKLAQHIESSVMEEKESDGTK